MASRQGMIRTTIALGLAFGANGRLYAVDPGFETDRVLMATGFASAYLCVLAVPMFLDGKLDKLSEIKLENVTVTPFTPGK